MSEISPSSSPMRTLTPADLPAPLKSQRDWPWDEAPALLPPTLADGRPWPPIGIVTPSFNQGRYIEETIRSVLLQGYPALEYFVIDGGSTDESVEIIRRYEKFISGWVSEKDRGQSHAINKGVARIQNAQWINWLNSDDILLPRALETIGRWAARGSGAVLAIGKGLHYLEDRGETAPYERRDDLDAVKIRNWHSYPFLQPAAFFSKKAFDACGGVNEALHLAMDFELWVKLGETGKFDLLDHEIARDRLHREAKTYSGISRYYGEALGVLMDRGHKREAIEMLEAVYEDYNYLSRLVSPIAENPLYKRFLRPWIRRRYRRAGRT